MALDLDLGRVSWQCKQARANFRRWQWLETVPFDFKVDTFRNHFFCWDGSSEFPLHVLSM